jgi:hypothetical protein
MCGAWTAIDSETHLCCNCGPDDEQDECPSLPIQDTCNCLECWFKTASPEEIARLEQEYALDNDLWHEE